MAQTRKPKLREVNSPQVLPLPCDEEPGPSPSGWVQRPCALRPHCPHQAEGGHSVIPRPAFGGCGNCAEAPGEREDQVVASRQDRKTLPRGKVSVVCPWKVSSKPRARWKTLPATDSSQDSPTLPLQRPRLPEGMTPKLSALQCVSSACYLEFCSHGPLRLVSTAHPRPRQHPLSVVSRAHLFIHESVPTHHILLFLRRSLFNHRT